MSVCELKGEAVGRARAFFALFIAPSRPEASVRALYAVNKEKGSSLARFGFISSGLMREGQRNETRSPALHPPDQTDGAPRASPMNWLEAKPTGVSVPRESRLRGRGLRRRRRGGLKGEGRASSGPLPRRRMFTFARSVYQRSSGAGSHCCARRWRKLPTKSGLVLWVVAAVASVDISR